ncbi:MAG: murein L,D-transpeptidase catalytic domain family protein [Bacteroidetes bacterium]|nr:murein L,D-transpeptidase catalytic domain family protein [Bacteroidota bacterium]
MQKKLKGFFLLFTSFLVCFAYFPFAFGKKNLYSLQSFQHSDKTLIRSTDSVALIVSHRSIYDSLRLDLSGLNKKAFDIAQKGFYKIERQGRLSNDSVLSIIDFSQSSDKKRLYVLDMKNYKILYNTLVAHGRNSGKLWAQSFSNRPSSYKSSIGFYITGQTYEGNNGYSLKLEGLEKGFNNNAGRRAIVLHGAGYVCDSYINDQGYIGRSEGCPAVPQQYAADIINTIKEGTCLFIYHPNKLYAQRSLLAKG